MYITLFLIGLLGGFITGMLSLGGGIILIFLLILIPPLVAGTSFSMQVIAGFGIMQAFFSTLSGSIAYIRAHLVDRSIVIYLGVPSFVGGMMGAFMAQFFSESMIKLIFALFSLLAAMVMFIPQPKVEGETAYSFAKWSILLSALSGVVIGILGGIVGLAAGFIFIPLMMYLFHLPIKKAIGTSLLTCFLLAFGALVTKIGLSHLPLGLGAIMICGGIIGAQIGSRLSQSMSSVVLRRIAAFSILLISMKLFYDLF